MKPQMDTDNTDFADGLTPIGLGVAQADVPCKSVFIRGSQPGVARTKKSSRSGGGLRPLLALRSVLGGGLRSDPRRASSAERRARECKAFTLIELLIVIGIAAMMMALAVPAFKNIQRANAVTSGASELANTITLARAWAVTERTRVAVVFAMNRTNSDSSPAAPSMLAYSVLGEDPPRSGNWKYLERWHEVSFGAFIPAQGAHAPTPSLKEANFPFPTNGASPLTSLRHIVFTSSGSPAQFEPGIATMGSPREISVQEGTVLPNGKLASTNSANRLLVTIYPVSGKTTVSNPP